jgi:hypothetical protein
MADPESVFAHQDLFHQQTQDFLALAHLQRIGPQAQLGTETRERFCQPQAMRLIGAGGFQRLPFGLHCLLLLAQLRHASAKLLQAHQTFLIPESGVKRMIRSRAASVGGSFGVFRAPGLVGSGIL